MYIERIHFIDAPNDGILYNNSR